MSRRYRSQPIEVGTEVGTEVGAGQDGAPAWFRWRGRRYVVRAVTATWVEPVPWWPRELRGGRGSGQRHAWRVEAAAATGAVGVYELCRIRYRAARAESPDETDAWVLVRVID